MSKQIERDRQGLSQSSQSGRGRSSEHQKHQHDKRQRSTAEWISFVVSTGILLAVLGMVGYVYFARGGRPAVIEVTPRFEELRFENDAYYLPISVVNRGDETAENVQIQVVLTPGQGQPEVAQFQINFLAGGETNRAVAVFRTRPTPENTAIGVISYLKS